MAVEAATAVPAVPEILVAIPAIACPTSVPEAPQAVTCIPDWMRSVIAEAAIEVVGSAAAEQIMQALSSAQLVADGSADAAQVMAAAAHTVLVEVVGSAVAEQIMQAATASVAELYASATIGMRGNGAAIVDAAAAIGVQAHTVAVVESSVTASMRLTLPSTTSWIVAAGSAQRMGWMDNQSGSRAATTVPHDSWTDLFAYTAGGGSATATVNFSISHSWGSHFLHWASEQRGIRILVNGSQVASQTQSYTTGSWSTTLNQNGVSVPAGAWVQIQGYAQGSVYTQPRTVTVSAASMTVTGLT